MEPAKDAEWLELVASLNDRVPELVRRFLEEFAERGLYDEESVSPEDLHDTAEATFTMLIARLTNPELDHSEVAEDLGVRRARQGVPVGALLEAVRIDFRILWRMMHETVDPASMHVLMDNVEWLLTVVEQYVSEVQQAFLREAAVLQSDARLATERFLARLFNLAAPSRAFLEEVATQLGVDQAATFEAISIPSEWVERAQRRLAKQLAGGEIHSYGFRGTLFLFRQVPEEGTSWAREHASLPSVYIGSIDGLESVPEVARATIAIHAANPHLEELAEIEDVWAATANEYFETLLPGFTERFLGGLEELSDYERERIVSTIREYLTTGSIKQTAEAVFCHRNTVINRLRVFTDATGLNVTVPAQAALAQVVLSHRYELSSMENSAK